MMCWVGPLAVKHSSDLSSHRLQVRRGITNVGSVDAVCLDKICFEACNMADPENLVVDIERISCHFFLSTIVTLFPTSVAFPRPKKEYPLHKSLQICRGGGGDRSTTVWGCRRRSQRNESARPCTKQQTATPEAIQRPTQSPGANSTRRRREPTATMMNTSSLKRRKKSRFEAPIYLPNWLPASAGVKLAGQSRERKLRYDLT